MFLFPTLGKSTLMFQMIKNRKSWINGDIKRIVFCYSYLSEDLLDIKRKEPNDVYLVDNLDDVDTYLVRNTLLVLDDQLTLLNNKIAAQKITDFFTKRAAHEHLSVCVLIQNLFIPSMRTISINTSYMIIMNCPKDKTIATTLAKQFSPHNTRYFLEAYKDACVNRLRGYLLLDFNQTTPEKFRVRSALYPSDDMIIYVPL